MQLLVGVGHEQVGAAVPAVVGGSDSHSGVGIADARARCSLLEAEAEPRSGSPGCGNVQVEPVRVGVVRDVEIEAPIVVHVGEHGPEAVLDAGVDTGLLADLPEPCVAVPVVPRVEVEQVADPRWSFGNPEAELGIGAFTSV